MLRTELYSDHADKRILWHDAIYGVVQAEHWEKTRWWMLSVRAGGFSMPNMREVVIDGAGAGFGRG